MRFMSGGRADKLHVITNLLNLQQQQKKKEIINNMQIIKNSNDYFPHD